MKKALCFVFVVSLATAAAVAAEEGPLDGVRTSLKDQLFVVESDEMSESDSLNRISGNIDLGFALPSQSYESENHYKAGPFGRAEAMDQSQGY